MSRTDKGNDSSKRNRRFAVSAEHPTIFRVVALSGIIVAIFLILHPYLTLGPQSDRASADAAAAQALGAALAAAALLVATWAVIVTKDIATKIEQSGANDDVIAANTLLQNQWQVLNLELIRDKTLRSRWEPNDPTPDGIPYFEERLAIFFYIMQILKQAMLYRSMNIPIALNDESRRHWALWLTETEKPIWDWVNERGRGFSDGDRAEILDWAAEQRSVKQVKSA